MKRLSNLEIRPRCNISFPRTFICLWRCFNFAVLATRVGSSTCFWFEGDAAQTIVLKASTDFPYHHSLFLSTTVEQAHSETDPKGRQDLHKLTQAYAYVFYICPAWLLAVHLTRSMSSLL